MDEPSGPYRGRRLVRSNTERMLSGVAGGMAEYFEVDPVLVRLIWIAATILSSGVLLLLYIACWIIMPRDDQVARRAFSEASREGEPRQGSSGPVSEEPSEGVPTVGDAASTTAPPPAYGAGLAPASRPPRWGERNRHRTAGLILVGLGLVFLAAQAGVLRWVQWQVVWPLVLIAIGVALLLRRRD